MKFNIVLGCQEGLELPISYYLHGCEDKADIFLASYICAKCDADQTFVFFSQMLEHEIVEILCTLIRFEDGEKDVMNEGFDKLCLKWHYKSESHICGDGTKIMWSG